jgi:hypothetical protein
MMRPVYDVSLFDIINVHICESVVDWETTINGHRVAYRKMPPGAAYEMGYVCDCKGFTFHGRKCKHTAAAELMRCHWGEEGFAGSPQQPNDDGTCPQCGGETRVVRVRI